MNKMFVLLFIMLFNFLTSFSQGHKNICKLTVEKAEPVVLNNKLRWYKLVISNGSTKTIDALEWDAVFYDKFDKYLGTASGRYSSGGTISKPIQPGEKLTDRETPEGIGDADRVIITLRKVHYVGGGTCN